MSDSTLLFVHVVHIDDDGDVGEMDMIAAIRQVVVNLYNSANQAENTDGIPNIVVAGFQVHKNEPKVKARMLYGDAHILSLVSNQLVNMQSLSQMADLGPDIERHMPGQHKRVDHDTIEDLLNNLFDQDSDES